MVVDTQASFDFDTAETEEDAKFAAFMDGLRASIAEQKNWKTRKKAFLDALQFLDVLTENAERAEADEETDREEWLENELFLETAPVFIARVLDAIAEDRISCIEQAAFYLMSADEDHFAMADAWLMADYRNYRQFKKFLRANRYYRSIVDSLVQQREWDNDLD